MEPEQLVECPSCQTALSVATVHRQDRRCRCGLELGLIVTCPGCKRPVAGAAILARNGACPHCAHNWFG